MENSKNTFSTSSITSNSFLEQVLPQIKISQKIFPLDGIDPSGFPKTITNSVIKVSSKR